MHRATAIWIVAPCIVESVPAFWAEPPSGVLSLGRPADRGAPFMTFPAIVHIPLRNSLMNRQVIVSMQPVNGAKEVDPATTEIKVTCDTPMACGMSWVGGGASVPTVPEGQRGKWSDDRRTCTVPVTLQPGHTYKLGINAPKYTNFQRNGKCLQSP